MMRRMARLLAALVGAGVVAHAAAWLLLAEAVRSGIERPGPAGETLVHGGLGLSGWPGPVVRTINAPRLTRPSDGLVPAVTIEAKTAQTRTSLLAPRKVDVILGCPCRLEAIGQLRAATAAMDAAALRLDLRFEGGGRLIRWSLEGSDVALVADEAAVEIAAMRLTTSRRDTPEPMSTVLFSLEGVRLAAAANTPFGSVIRSLDGEVVLKGQLEPTLPAEVALRRWREAEGRIEVRRLSLAWGPLAASAGLILSLDPALQPTGAGTIRVANWRAAIESLESSGALPRQTAAFARLGLGIIAREPPGAGASVVEVPFAVENRILSAARIPLLELPALAWPR